MNMRWWDGAGFDAILNLRMPAGQPVSTEKNL